jgi:hypothetical protein
VLAGHPDPENETLVTVAWPVVGLISTDGVTTVKVWSFVLLAVSVMWMVWVPVAAAGTWKVAPVSVPLTLVVVVPDRVSGLPSKVAEIVALAANPLALIVTVAPGLPDVGLRLADGVIVSWWAALTVIPALLVTWTV